MEQRSEEWFEARKGLLTASNVGAVLGMAPYATRADVMRRMVREWHGAEPEFTGNIATEYGERNEPGAIIEYEMESGDDVRHVGFVVHPEGWAGASPDGLIGDDAGLEVKCPFGKRKDVDPDFKPLAEQPHYYAQIQFTLWVTGRARWVFFQWSGAGTKTEIVTPDAEWLAENMPKLRQFYAEYLHDREDPEAVAMHLEAKRVVIDTPEAHRMMAEYDQICEALENAEARKKELVADMVRIAGGKNATFAGRALTKTEKAGQIAYAKAVKALMPNADLEAYRGKPSSYWGVR